MTYSGNESDFASPRIGCPFSQQVRSERVELGNLFLETRNAIAVYCFYM